MFEKNGNAGMNKNEKFARGFQFEINDQVWEVKNSFASDGIEWRDVYCLSTGEKEALELRVLENDEQAGVLKRLGYRSKAKNKTIEDS